MFRRTTERSAEAFFQARIQFQDDTLSCQIAKCDVSGKTAQIKNTVWNNKPLKNGILLRSTSVMVVDFGDEYIYYRAYMRVGSFFGKPVTSCLDIFLCHQLLDTVSKCYASARVDSCLIMMPLHCAPLCTVGHHEKFVS